MRLCAHNFNIGAKIKKNILNTLFCYRVHRCSPVECAEIFEEFMGGISSPTRCLQACAGKLLRMTLGKCNPITTIIAICLSHQLNIEFRPETLSGIILLTGERDDLTGDFMAVLIHEGFIEFW